jgi:hypothetical protein
MGCFQARSHNCEKRLLASTCLSVCPVRMKILVPTGSAFMKFCYFCIFLKSVAEIQDSVRSDKKNDYFTKRPIYIIDHISLVILRMRDVSERVLEKKKTHILFFLMFF